MKVANFMSRDVLILNPDTLLRDTAELFLKNKIDGAPVIKDNQLAGLVTKTHLIRAMCNNTDLNKPIRDLMSTNVKSLNPDENIQSVDILYTGRYPVMKNDQLIGMLTKSDIMVAMREILDELSGQLETVINSTYNPIVAIDNEGLITIWNNAAERMTGLKYRDVIGKYINNIIPESELIKIIETGKSEFGSKLRVGNVTTITNRAPIIKHGKIIGAVAVLNDISELEKISRELDYVKTLNKELDAIFDCSFDGLYITDGKAMTLRINHAIKRMTGLGEEELVNKTMNELVDTGILSRSASVIVIKDKKPVTTTLVTVTGTTLLVSANPIFNENGEVYRVVTNVRDISELNMLKQKVEQLEGLKNHFEFQMNQMKAKLSGELIYKNIEMEKIVYQAFKIAEVDSTVLISGESGVGKEVIAEIIHKNSLRKNGPFVKLNCAAIPENLLESELFGYETGAFTGARREGKPGLFEVADEGTLLLDEIGDIPLHLQVKLLRALQEREIFRVGGTKPIRVNVRIIAITNKNLESMVNNGQFREDLFYRLNVVPINVPPLRERTEDIPKLVQHFLNQVNKRYNLKKSIEPDLIEILMRFNWPGNIRQLENLIERLVVTTSTENIGIQQLPAYYFNNSGDAMGENGSAVSVNRIVPLKSAVENVEKLLLEKAFAIVDSRYKAAELLGVDASTISRKANKYKIKFKE